MAFRSFRYAPVAKGSSTRQMASRFGRSKVFTVSNREFVTDVYATTGSLTPIVQNNINAQSVNMFKWLNNIAQQFDRYRFSWLRFTYEPQCPTSTAGNIIMTVDRDPADIFLADGTKRAYDWSSLSQMPGSIHGAIWSNHTINVGCDSLLRFCNSELDKDPADRRLTDLGTWLCYIEGVGPSTDLPLTCGKLYVEYVCHLYDTDSSSSISGGEGAKYANAAVAAAAGAGVNIFYQWNPTLVTTGTKAGQNLLEITGTTSANTTAVFRTPFEGLMTVTVAGNTLGNLSPPTVTLPSGTITLKTSTVNGTSGASYTYTIKASAGNSLRFEITWTTLSSTEIRFADYDYNNN